MKKFILLLLILVGFYSCKKDNDDISNDFRTLLVEGFEYENINEFYEKSEWIGSAEKLITDAPDNGGNKSIQLKAGWCPSEAYIETNFSNLINTNIIKLSIAYKFRDLDGKAFIKLKNRNNNDAWITHELSVSDTSWNEILLTDTLSFDQNDTLSIRLTSGCGEILDWRVLFDKIKLESFEL